MKNGAGWRKRRNQGQAGMNTDPVFAPVGIVLLHYPVYDRNGRTVVSAITNLDLHDIARAAKTFGLFRYYVVTPVTGQQQMAAQIIGHWREGWGATYNPKRKAALDQVRVKDTLDEVVGEVTAEFGEAPAARGHRCGGRGDHRVLCISGRNSGRRRSRTSSSLAPGGDWRMRSWPALTRSCRRSRGRAIITTCRSVRRRRSSWTGSLAGEQAQHHGTHAL